MKYSSKKELLLNEISNIEDEELIRKIYYFTIHIKPKNNFEIGENIKKE